MVMHFRYTILYVEDVGATLEFYARTFGMQTKMLHESGDYGELSTGETTLSFSSRELLRQLGKSPAAPSPENPTFEIAFETTEVERMFRAACDAGAKAVQEPRREPWGQTTAYVSDLNGFLVEICSPVEATAT